MAKKKISIRVDESILRDIQLMAKLNRIKFSDCVNRLIRQGLSNKKEAIKNTFTNEELLASCQYWDKKLAGMAAEMGVDLTAEPLEDDDDDFDELTKGWGLDDFQF